MASAAHKDIIREIKNSRNRFLAIMVLSALAVAFLCGLKVTAPDMKGTGDDYLDDRRLMDIQVMSTLGITEKDVEALASREEIDYAVGAYVMDAWAGDSVAKVYSITEEVNKLILMEGRLPVVSRECVVDEKILAKLDLSIGDTLPIVPSEDNRDSLIYDDFRIVGTVRSPYYISVERGSSSIGSGSVQGYVYLKENAFNMDCYTIAYLKAKGAEELTAFTDEYDDYIEAVIDALEPMGEERAQLRHDEIIDEAMEKIAEAEQELADAEKEVADKIAEAEQELADARKKLDNGWYEYRKGKKDFEEAHDKLVEGQIELSEGYQELLEGQKEYDDGLAEYEKSFAEYEANKKTLDELYAALSASQSQLDAVTGPLNLGGSFTESEASSAISSAKSAAAEGIAQCETAITAAKSGIYACDAKIEELSGKPDSSGIRAAIAAEETKKQEYENNIGALTAQISQLEAQIQSLDQIDAAQLSKDNAALQAGWKEYNDGKALFDAGKEKLDAAKKKLDSGKKELEAGWREYYDGRQKLTEGWQEYYDGKEELPRAYRKLKDGETEYEDGLADLEKARIEAAEEVADAKDELADARREVADIEAGEWYILPRGYNPGYTGFGQDAERMANLATVFPVIFFIVAGLVCLTTMTRMVEEHRTEIGLMKALGYDRWTISAKYLSYGLLPSLAGGALGLVIGHTLFPVMIYISYQILYEMPDITLRFYPGLSALAVFAAVACTTLSTLWACLSTLEDFPANLMRPRAPKPGKRVLLERITPLWRSMSFKWKITTRNLFRYQKRFWMTVIGISGCTALVMAGIGLRESLTTSMRVQYDELFNYDVQITFAEGLLGDERAEIEEYLGVSEEVKDYAYIYASGVTAQSDAYSTSAYIEVFDPEEIEKFVLIRDYGTDEKLALPEHGVLMDKKLSELLDIGVGDSFIIDSDGLHTAVVAGIYENYVGHFIYLSPGGYEEIFREAPEANGMMLNLADGSRETCERVTTKLLAFNGVSAAVRAADTQDIYLKSMERVDFVVVVVILCAAALAIVVLYNLSNINMTERMRELATIKVLGFYDGEVSAYVYRENIVLTIVGIALGCVMGKYLHGWMIRSVEIDLMMFGREVTAGCYLLSAGLTALFAVIVNIIAHEQMKKIDMVESLKSAE